MQIVSPGAEEIDSPFLHVAPQVTLVRAKALEFLDQFRS